MPGIFVDIYFLKASTLSYLMPLVSTLAAGARVTYVTDV